MTKKLLMACMALVAFAALALPAAASATTLTENGKVVAVGSKITATQVGVSKMTNTEGTKTQLECSTGTITGTLTKNNNTDVEGEITSAVFGGTGPQATGEPAKECTGESAFGNASITPQVSAAAPWCIKTTGAPKDEITVIGGNCGGATSNIKFKFVTTLVGTCEYESTGHLVGTYTTNGTSATATLTNTIHKEGEATTTNGFKRTNANAFCPASGSLDMTFTLETDSTTVEPLVLS